VSSSSFKRRPQTSAYLFGAHPIKIVRHLPLSGQEAETALGRVDRHHFDKGTASFGDDERLAGGCPLDQARQVRLGLIISAPP